MIQQDYKVQLQRQLGFIERSCASFDDGYLDEAIRIGVTLRVLFHDTAKSTSLLKHMNARHIKLLSTVSEISIPDDIDIVNIVGLEFQGMGQHCVINKKFEFQPFLSRLATHREIELDNWWQQPVTVFQKNTILTRKDIILAAANKDGGAHVDSELTLEYAALAESGAFGFHIHTSNFGENEMIPIDNAHLVYLRQMGFEVLNSDELIQLTI